MDLMAEAKGSTQKCAKVNGITTGAPDTCVSVWGLGLRVRDFRVGAGFRVWVWGLGFGVWLGAQGLEFRLGSGFRLDGLGNAPASTRIALHSKRTHSTAREHLL